MMDMDNVDNAANVDDGNGCYVERYVMLCYANANADARSCAMVCYAIIRVVLRC